MVPVRKFSMRTSALATSLFRMACASGVFRFKVMFRLLRFMLRYPDASPATNGGHVRDSSPPSGSSTFSTSAPMSANIMAQYGPARTRERSRTVTPSSAYVMRFSLWSIVESSRGQWTRTDETGLGPYDCITSSGGVGVFRGWLLLFD